MKKLTYLVSLILVCLTLNSCVTKNFLWVPKIDEDEVIKDLLINDDGSQLILVGKKYSYFLSDEEKKIKKLLAWDWKDKLKTTTGVVARGDKVEVDFWIDATLKDLSEKQIRFLKLINGKIFDWGKKISIPAIELKGTRVPSDMALITDFEKNFTSTGLIKSEYKESIFEKRTPSQTFGKILLTPFAVAADIVLAPVYLVTAITIGILNHHANHTSDAKK